MTVSAWLPLVQLRRGLGAGTGAGPPDARNADGDAIGYTNGDADSFSNTYCYTERNPESDTTTAPDTVPAPNTIAKGCNPFCGDSRNTLASSRKGDERGGCAGSRACCDNLDLQATRLPLQVSATEQ